MMTKEGTINGNNILEFIKSLVQVKSKLEVKKAQPYVILMDNASIHKTAAIK